MNDYLRSAFEELYENDGLCVMAPGLGIKQLLVKFIRGYSDETEKNVVICLNCADEAKWIFDGLRSEGIRPDNFPKLILGDTLGQDRGMLYSRGGCFIATSRIVINDLLKEVIQPTQIAGILVYNAQRVTETCTEAFISRVFKQGNPSGFVKVLSRAIHVSSVQLMSSLLDQAFCEDPQTLSQGFSTLERVMQQLYLKKLFLWPRFHEHVQNALSGDRREPEVIELCQTLTPPMVTVQTSILAAMQTCLQELKKAAPQLDAASLTLENGIFYSFDKVVRSQLDPEWHRLSFRTKQLVADLTTLRQLLDYLIRYDAVTFYGFLLTVKAAGASQYSPSMWLTSSIADNLFRCSRERVLRVEKVQPDDAVGSLSREMGLSEQFIPVIEIPPKWILLREVLKEIRDDFNRLKASAQSTSSPLQTKSTLLKSLCLPIGSSRIVIIVRDGRSVCQIRDFLSCSAYNTHKPASSASSMGAQNTAVTLEGNLHAAMRQFVTQQATSIRQQGTTSRGSTIGGSAGRGRGSGRGGDKDKERGRTLSYSSSRQGGTAPSPRAWTEQAFQNLRAEQKMMLVLEKNLQTNVVGMPVLGIGDNLSSVDTIYPDSDDLVSADGEVKISDGRKRHAPSGNDVDNAPSGNQKRSRSAHRSTCSTSPEKKAHMGVADTMTGDDDTDNPTATLLDDQLHIYILTHEMCQSSYSPFEDIRPTRVIFLDADVATIRLVETYQAGSMRENMKVYFLIYADSIEEHRYIASLKREKQAFENLIHKKSHMAIELPDTVLAVNHSKEYGLLPSDSRCKAKERARPVTVVDMREFGSSLPSLLHLNGFVLQPVTLLVGDYILAPQICVERKGISDLFQSFASGRLYSQVESMSRHYDLPALLVEFTPNRSFSLQAESEIPSDIQAGNICSKIALLVIAFPSLRILWSRSPHATIDIFRSLKSNFDEPEVEAAMAIGGDSGCGSTGLPHIEGDDSSSQDMEAIARDILLSLPGINSTNVRAIINNVEDLAHLSRMSVAELTPHVGPVNAKKLVDFFVREE